MKLKFQTLVQSVVFDPIETDSDEDFSFKLDIFQKANGKFCGQLYRREMYSFVCTFNDMKPDELIYIFDSHTLPELDEQEFPNAEACLKYTVQSLESAFNL